MQKPDTDFEDEMRPNYDRATLGTGTRGKHFAEYQAGTNVAFLAPDVRAAFPTDEELNDALRLLIRVARREALPL